ncbi:cell envelope integrity protein CreD [Polluticaenibacter yanchengensis]|uniref:Cell envelope integrity protein CreD n=1 Tax=Polluticaenibacter yanchengensis TaxID=3014562 RepID=A0ABT4UL69_9BACT|nr:cell envelope integrity protein CreD [Chitinophagaceae bacterium LY-5]
MQTNKWLTFRIWQLTVLIFTILLFVTNIVDNHALDASLLFIVFIVAEVLTIPAAIILAIAIKIISDKNHTVAKSRREVYMMAFAIGLVYSLFVFCITGFRDFDSILFAAGINLSILLALLFSNNAFAERFTKSTTSEYDLTSLEEFPDTESDNNLTDPAYNELTFNQQSNLEIMEPITSQNPPVNNTGNHSVLLKLGIILGIVLILLIPSTLIMGLVSERHMRSNEVKEEISAKWADPQLLSGLYLTVPYIEFVKLDSGKIRREEGTFILIPETLEVHDSINTEPKGRSLFNVLLYTSNSKFTGTFNYKIPNGVEPQNVFWDRAVASFGISDFKGINKISKLTIGTQSLSMEPGGVDTRIAEKGLSTPVNLTGFSEAEPLKFNLELSIKGSEQLHYLPLAANSSFYQKSNWSSPSFNGYKVSSDYKIENGYTAEWHFNKASLPFTTTIQHNLNDKELSFGVKLIQPTDHYNSTNRSIKYAILIIGLTFGLFFIFENVQKKQVHPIQYALIGLAMVVFYILLLAISEYTGFAIAYLIASSATVLLISSFIQGLLKSTKATITLAVFISFLYGFLFTLIQLEDTALITGSIGLFILLAIAMHFSKKINWYNKTPHAAA